MIFKSWLIEIVSKPADAAIELKTIARNSREKVFMVVALKIIEDKYKDMILILPNPRKNNVRAGCKLNRK